MDLDSYRKTLETGSKTRSVEKVVAKEELHDGHDRTEDKLLTFARSRC